MALTVVTEPTAEPVSLAEAKAHLRVDIEDDDNLIFDLIVTARQVVEDKTRTALMQQTWDYFLDAWPTVAEIKLPLPPLSSVTSLKYTDEDDNETTWASSNYRVDADSMPGRIVLKNSVSWPTSNTLKSVNAIAVRFVAGYADAASVPERYKQAIRLLIGAMYENREEFIVGQGFSSLSIPFGVDALLRPRKVFKF